MQPGRPWGSILGLIIVVGICLLTLKVYSWYQWERVRHLTIVYGSDLRGGLEPCGCIEGMLGGLARRATFVSSVRQEGNPTLLLDSGGIFFRESTVPDYLKGQLSRKADAIVDAYQQMGYDAANVGDADIALGIERLGGIGERASFPLLSANLVRVDGERAFAPHLIREIGGMKVGIFGLLGREGEKSPVRLLDPVTVAKEVVTELRPQADLLICLSHQGLSRDVQLSREVSGIDVILGGGSGSSLPRPRVENGTIILQTGQKGRTIGRFDLVLYNDEEPWEDATESEKYRRLAAEYEAVVEKHQATLTSTQDPAEKYDAQRMVERYTKEREIAAGRVRDFFGRNHFYNQVVPLNQTYADDPGILEIIAAYKADVRSLAERGRREEVAGPRLYEGADSCRGCHEAEYESWKATPHAQAFETLKETDREWDLECIGCHTTGYRKEGGYLGPVAAGELRGVQCEVCHGPGTGHPEDRPKLPLERSQGVCFACHTEEYNPDFDFGEFWARIRHRRDAEPSGGSRRR